MFGKDKQDCMISDAFVGHRVVRNFAPQKFPCVLARSLLLYNGLLSLLLYYYLFDVMVGCHTIIQAKNTTSMGIATSLSYIIIRFISWLCPTRSCRSKTRPAWLKSPSKTPPRAASRSTFTTSCAPVTPDSIFFSQVNMP